MHGLNYNKYYNIKNMDARDDDNNKTNNFKITLTLKL